MSGLCNKKLYLKKAIFKKSRGLCILKKLEHSTKREIQHTK